MTDTRPRCALITLGCPKNLVDAEAMAVVLRDAGWATASRADDADVIIVNTCGFIQPAVAESMDAIRELAAAKRPGQRLIVAGCLAERSAGAIVQAAPAVDAVLGTLRWAEIAEVLRLPAQTEPRILTGPGSARPTIDRVATGSSAYIKISEGCDAVCAFCTIPTIKGGQISRPMAALVAEAAELARRGVHELVLIGQDTTSYGRDLGLDDGLATLLGAICDAIPEHLWLRCMYAYPTRLSDRLLATMRERPQLVEYLDMPLQHSHPDVLGRMGRPRGDALRLLDRVRTAVPEVAIRSTFIVGFPGETDAEFEHLLAFLRTARLDRVGIFEFSSEPGTPAAVMPNQVPGEVMRERAQQVAALQEELSRQALRALVGTEMPVLIEGAVERPGRNRGCTVVGRSRRDAPEVDGLVYVREPVRSPAFVRVRIDSSSAHDLYGHVSG